MYVLGTSHQHHILKSSLACKTIISIQLVNGLNHLGHLSHRPMNLRCDTTIERCQPAKRCTQSQHQMRRVDTSTNTVDDCAGSGRQSFEIQLMNQQTEHISVRDL